MARIKVTFSDAEQAAIDRLRGQVPAATWVRRLVREAAVAARVLEEASSEAEGAVLGEQAGPAPVGPSGVIGPSGPVRPAAPPRASAPVKRAASPPMPVRPLVSQPRPLVQKRG